MARTVVITERDENRVAYDIKDENGVVVESGAKPIAPLLEKMRATRRNLKTVLARELGAGAVPAPMMTAVVDVTEPDATPLGLDELYDHFAEKEHGHDFDGHVPGPHIHRDFAETQAALNALTERVETFVTATETTLTAIRRDLQHHDHDVPAHPHQSMTARLDAHDEALKGLEARPTAQPVSLEGYVTVEALTRQVTELRGAIDALRDRVEESVQRNQRAIEAIPQPVETPMAEIQRLVRDAVKAAVTDKKGRPVAYLSTQTVNGKERLTLEALDAN